ncbi:hypothetical protein, partial [Escherichia coli]|uniref:hypothetical protein n=1 Tax=Escherichia coli TaxID=562 RepID=UPI0019547E7E
MRRNSLIRTLRKDAIGAKSDDGGGKDHVRDREHVEVGGGARRVRGNVARREIIELMDETIERE